MVLTINQRTFIIESYFRSGRSVNGHWIYSFDKCIVDFEKEYPNVLSITKQSINNLIKKFRSTGFVQNKEHVRRRTRLSEHVIEDIQQRINQSPNKSLRRLSNETGLSYGSCQNALRNRLRLYPYRVTCLHELLPHDYAKRIAYCTWFQENMNDSKLDMTFFTDEVWINLSGYINSQTSRIWSSNNPHNFVQSPLHPLKLSVWIAISKSKIIGPIIFQETINSVQYNNNKNNNNNNNKITGDLCYNMSIINTLVLDTSPLNNLYQV